MRRAVAYCRVSTDHDDQLSSLNNQIKHYTELFQKENIEGAECGMYYSKAETKYIKSIFADEGISGTKLKNREAFKRMLECANRKEFNVIYVKNIQRWARNVEDGSGILKRLKVLGIEVIFEDGNLSNLRDEMTINILLSMSQEESRAKSVAIKFGIRKAQQDGKFTSAVPYGYKLENGFLRPILEQIEVVKSIFDLYLNGYGGTKISQKLRSENVPTAKGGLWSPRLIYQILQNEIYIGKQVTHTVEYKDVNIQCIEKVKKEDQIIHENEELRAVSNNAFFAVQEEMAHRKSNINTHSSNEHILSNLMYCRHCGRAMRRKKLLREKRKDGTRKEYVEWVCTNHDFFREQGCKYRNAWKEDKLIDRVGSEIKKLKENKQLLDDMFLKYLNSFAGDIEVAKKTGVLESKLSDIKNTIDTNLRLLTKYIINEDQYKEQNDKLQAEKKNIENEIYKLGQIENERQSAYRKYDNYVNFIENVDISNLDNSILKKMITKIECFTAKVDGEEIKDIYIVWNLLNKSFDDLLI